MEIYPSVHFNQNLLWDYSALGAKNRKVKDTCPYTYSMADSHVEGKMDVQCDCYRKGRYSFLPGGRKW